MIFRTITDESTGAVKSIGIFGKTLNELKSSFANIKTNGLLNSIFKTSSIDTKAIDAYNKAITEATKNNVSMADKQQIMQTAMKGTNKETARLIGSTKGAEVGLKELKAAQDATTLSAKAGQVVLKGLSMAGNMLAGMLISFAISKVIEGIYNLATASERAIEASDNAKSAISSLKDELKNSTEKAKEAGKEYAELAQGVDQLNNKNVSLSTDEYEKFLDLSNELAEIFPTLIKGYDAEGNAILDLSGNLDEINIKLQTQIDKKKELSSLEQYQAFMGEGTDENGKKREDGYYTGAKIKVDEISQNKVQTEKELEELKKRNKYFEEDTEENDALINKVKLGEKKEKKLLMLLGRMLILLD